MLEELSNQSQNNKIKSLKSHHQQVISSLKEAHKDEVDQIRADFDAQIESVEQDLRYHMSEEFEKEIELMRSKMQEQYNQDIAEHT